MNVEYRLSNGLRRIPLQTPPTGVTDEVVIQPTALYKALELWDYNPILTVVSRFREQQEINVQPLLPKRAGANYWLMTPYRFVPASAEYQPRYLRRAREPVQMSQSEIAASRYAAPRFPYRRHEDGAEVAYVSFRWKLGTDYDPAMDVNNTEQYRKCREYLERKYLERERLRRSPPPVKTLLPKPKHRDVASPSSALPATPVDAIHSTDVNADSSAHSAADNRPSQRDAAPAEVSVVTSILSEH